MAHAPAGARARTVRALGTAAVGFVAILLLAPLTGVSAASARTASSPEPVFHPGTSTRFWFSPDGDKESDKARVYFHLLEKSRVTVKVRRTDKDRPLVHSEELGRLGARGHTWVWDGKDLDGDIVRDGKYSATFVADPVRQGGSSERRATVLWADTEFSKVTAGLSLDTVYPQTTLIRDAVEVRVVGKTNLATVKRVDWRLLDDQGRVALTGHRGGSWKAVAFPFDGRDGVGAPLPGGTYSLRVRVKDQAGNEGMAPPLTVTIDDKPLVEKVGTVVVRPTGAQQVSGGSGAAAPAPTPSTDPRIQPCGTVVPSTVYSTPGAQSFRSADWCTYRTTPHMAWAEGRVDLDGLTFAQAPRGLYSWQVAMRGRPAVAGETDTAELHLDRMEVGVYSSIPHTHGSVSPATTEESVTATATVTATPQPTYAAWNTTPYVRWVIATHGVDSFDVADVTVRYSYLTPQP